MFFKRFLCFVLISMFIFPFSFLKADALSEEEITAPSAILMEPTTNKILFEKNSHDIRPCASITKVMTLILIFEAIESGVLDYTDMITSSAHAASRGGSDIWLEEGEAMTVDHMLKAIVVASANDAAVAMAEAVAGSEDEFVNRMNEKAKTLGMHDTTFKNCNGLDEEGHLTSAYDVALMSAELIKHEKIFDYSSIWIDYLRGGETQIVNTNKLLKSYKGITGLKTGTTSQAGSCMSATAERDGMSLVAVVLGSATGTDRFKDCAKLLDCGFANYMVKELTIPGGTLNTIEVKDGMKGEVGITSVVKGNALLPKGSNTELEMKVELPEYLDAPLKIGDSAGKISFLYEGATVDEFPVTVTENVEKITFRSVFEHLLAELFSL